MAHWRLEKDGAIASLLFSRPPDHQQSYEDLVSLRAHLADLGNDETVSVVVLGAEEPATFLGSADLGEILAMRSGDRGRLEEWTQTTLALEELPQPVVAHVRGPARGGGCEVSLACTFRLAARSASFVQMEIDRGAMPGAGATQRLPRLVGPSLAAEMVMTGRPVGADEALALGLVSAVFDDADATDGMRSWTEALGSKPRAALVGTKTALRAAYEMPLERGLRLEQRIFRTVLGTERT